MKVAPLVVSTVETMVYLEGKMVAWLVVCWAASRVEKWVYLVARMAAPMAARSAAWSVLSMVASMGVMMAAQ